MADDQHCKGLKPHEIKKISHVYLTKTINVKKKFYNYLSLINFDFVNQKQAI